MSGPRVVYEDEHVTLWHGDYRDVIPRYASADLIVADPPYAETSLVWDRWPDGWPTHLAGLAASMWCFGSMRMFLERRDEFTIGGWRMSQDVVGRNEEGDSIFGDVHVVWEKHNGTGFQNDRFKRVHEHAVHWYRGDWHGQYRDVPTTADAVKRVVRTKRRPPQMGQIDKAPYVSEDGGPRLMRSVLQVRSMHGKAIHPTEKPVGILAPLIEYACPPGGVVLDPFAGSASTLVAARECGRQAIGVESREEYAEAAARRLAQLPISAGIEPAARE